MSETSDLGDDAQDVNSNTTTNLFKIIMVGDTAVGKTAFLLRFVEDAFSTMFISTVGIDFKVKTLVYNGAVHKLQLWDTAGQERYRSLIRSYYRGASGYILLYDITKERTFLSVRDWATEISDYGCEDAPVVLVGNKSDLEEERVITYEDGANLASELGFSFFETSVKDNEFVFEVVTKLVDNILQKITKNGGQDIYHFQNDKSEIAEEKPEESSCFC